jgi:TetR/AcrR family transcriptional regulator
LETIQIDDKKREIIEAAIKRFSHFGIAKTTLSEIADDLQMSKANLYYYFQDKWSLLEAIAEVLIHESNKRINEELDPTSPIATQLKQILKIKLELMQKYKLLTKNLSEVNVLDAKVKKIAKKVFEAETALIQQVISNGIKSGKIETIDALETSKLYVTTLRGLGMCGVYANPSPVLEMETLEEIHQQQLQLTDIFVNGIAKQK